MVFLTIQKVKKFLTPNTVHKTINTKCHILSKNVSNTNLNISKQNYCNMWKLYDSDLLCVI